MKIAGAALERMPRAVSPFGEIDRLFDDFFGRRWPRALGWDFPFPQRGEFGPNVDIIDRDDEILLRAELPGFGKEDIEVSVSGDTLTLAGKTGTEERARFGGGRRFSAISLRAR